MIRLPSDATIEDLSQADLANFSRHFAQGLSFSETLQILARELSGGQV